MPLCQVPRERKAQTAASLCLPVQIRRRSAIGAHERRRNWMPYEKHFHHSVLQMLFQRNSTNAARCWSRLFVVMMSS